ncbi:MAG: hypothetical protein IJT96_08555 [Lachnospiraceae bacterium]|nr:hypothetical protein [Lachnospiraceae bacterium]
MHFRIIELCEKIDCFERIVIYGAGDYARRVFQALNRVGYSKRIAGFVVSDPAPTQEIEGYIVKSIYDTDETFDDEASAYLAAVSYETQESIHSILSMLGKQSYIFLSDYVAEDSQEAAWERYYLHDEKTFWKNVIEWYICSGNSLDVKRDITELAHEIQTNHFDGRVQNELIVFIVGVVTARNARIIKALKKRNKRYAIEVMQFQGFPYAGDDELDRLGIKRAICGSVEELFYSAIQKKPQLFYIDAPNMCAVIPAVMCQFKYIFGKIIFTANDIVHGTYIGFPYYYYESERYALENADGIVWRYYSQNFIHQRFNINYGGKSIRFPDYCDDDTLYSMKKGDKLRFVCIINHLDDILLGRNGYTPLKRIINRLVGENKCEFYLYSKFADEDEMVYLEECRHYWKNFHYFINVNHMELMNSLGSFDYALYLFDDTKLVQFPYKLMERTSDDNTRSRYTEGMYRYSISNTTFELISAGIPLVTTKKGSFCEELMKEGVVYPMSITNLDIEYLYQNRDAARERVLRLRQKWLINEKIEELESFFDTIRLG